ncbi:MAG: response regulator [Lachnospiraceae bacterium]|nr:response regulator [Lachnospiraceae bacterium]
MNENIMEIAALILCTYYLSYCLIRRKNVYLKRRKGLSAKLHSQHFVFLMLLAAVELSAAASVLAAFLEGNLRWQRETLLLAVYMVYYLAHNAIGFLFAVYIINLTSGGLYLRDKAVKVLFAGLLLIEALILLNPLTRWFFYVGSDMSYHRGDYLWVLYLAGGFFIVFGVSWFGRFRGTEGRAKKTAALVLIGVSVVGILIQAVFGTATELFFESVTLLGFMSMLEERGEKRSGFGKGIIVLIAFVFSSAIIMNVALFRDLTREKEDEIRSVQVEGIRSDLQRLIADAESDVLRLSMGAEQLLNAGASLEELENYVADQKKTYMQNKPELCMNAYIAGDDWVLIPDSEIPLDYHFEESAWFNGAKENVGDIFISEPYIDAVSDTPCFTISTLFSSSELVAGMDFSFSEIGEYISHLDRGEGTEAIIVTESGILAGCDDMSLAGRRLEEALPSYSHVFKRAAASKSSGFFQASVDGVEQIVFSSVTENDWYLLLCVDRAVLYEDSDQGSILFFVINLLMLAVIIVFYMNGNWDKEWAEEKLGRQEAFISRLEKRVSEPVRQILLLSDMLRLKEKDSFEEAVGEIKASGLRLLETVENMAALEGEETEKKPAKAEMSQKDIRSGAVNKKVRNYIIAVLFAAMGSGLFLGIRTAVSWGDALMEGRMEACGNRLKEWEVREESILNMFSDMISEQPELMEDYEGAVLWLDDIVRNYAEISACYMANPYMEHTVIMNTGWQPEAGWKVEERQWYIDTEHSPTGINKSKPYKSIQEGVYCITFSRRVYGKDGEFLGIFAIDFFVDKLEDVLRESYTDTGYAFLVDAEGHILNHPNEAYMISNDESISIEDTEYADVYYEGKGGLLRDYDKSLICCLTREYPEVGFTIVLVSRWWTVYGNVVFIALVFLGLLGFSIASVVFLVNRLVKWQNEVNEQLLLAADAAVSAGKAKSQFLAQMSHEIRTPINAVLGMNELILDESRDPEVLSHAANIKSAGNTLLNLINSILDFSKIEDGRMELVPGRYDVRQMLDDIVNMTAERARSKGLAYNLEISPEIPGSLYGDDLRLRQIIVNILTNAVKYTRKGSVTLKIECAFSDEDSCELLVSVRDTGIGIKKEDLNELGTSFKRLDEEKNRGIEGTGLGLVIVQRLLAMMGSNLSVQSVYGEGSVFSFSIKQKIISREPIGPYEEAQKDGEKKAGARLKLRAPGADVLVVDDNRMNLQVAEGLMKRYGFVPELADSGEACLKMARAKHFDLIFLDHMMPGMDGVETLAKLKEESLLSEGTAVVVLTANAVTGARAEYLEKGFDGYLSKPIRIDELEDMLRKFLPPEKCVLAEPAGKEAGAQASGGDPLDLLAACSFNIRDGLGYAGGDERFYNEILRSFAGAADESAEKLESFCREGDLENYRICVHALKGNARMIGADRLSELAAAQEEAAKEGDSAAVGAGQEELVRHLLTAALAIREILGTNPGREPEAERKNAAGEEDLKARILVVDDDPNNLRAAWHILAGSHFGVLQASSGKEALDLLINKEERPDLILLDIHMPGLDGFETQERIRTYPGLSGIPVIFLTADEDSETESRGLMTGAMDFIKKPFVPGVLLTRVSHTIDLTRLQNDLESQVEEKTQAVVEQQNKLGRLSLQVVLALSGAVDAKDTYTNGHSKRVAEYARMIALRSGYSEERARNIYMIGLLHDIGKIGIPDQILNKPGKLTAEEFAVIKTHPAQGDRILKNITEFPELATGARWHHERYDGKGYPDGLAGEDIPEEARIIAVADAYDAMASRRSYRNPLPQDVVRGEIEKGRGTQFDPHFADIMLGLIDEDTEFTMRQPVEEHKEDGL